MYGRSILIVVAFLSACAIAQAADTGGGGVAVFIPDIFSFRMNTRPEIRLDGVWEFRRDPKDVGNRLGWHEGKGVFAEHVAIPGAPQAQGHGDPTATQKTAFQEQFWARRSFQLPALGPDQRVWLRLGGVLPAAEVYINGRYVGYTKSSRTQQRVDVTPFVKLGATNLIAIKVCLPPEIRLDGLWEMQEMICHWTGVYRSVFCEITDRFSVVDAYIQPKLSTGTANVQVTLSEPAGDASRLVLLVKDGRRTIGKTVTPIAKGADHAEAEVKLSDYTPWSPDHPKLYTLEMALLGDERTAATERVQLRFGMREITATKSKFLLNGKPVFLRCYGDDQLYPETLAPPPDKQWYLPRLKRARAYGMNAVKSCVEILSQDYIEAADEAGIMVIQEMPFGLAGLRAARYTISPPFRDFFLAELDGLVRESRNHASVVAYSMSSELEFGNQTQESFDFFSRELPEATRKLAPHALVTDCTGYLISEDTDKGKRVADFYAAFCHNMIKEALDETPTRTDGLHPVILHEFNWWSCYPDPKSRRKYETTQIKPSWLDTLERTARENGQEDLIPTYRANSLWLEDVCRKDGLEYARRCPGVEGQILWLLTDFGQYCEGVLDDFWSPKNVSARELRQSTGNTVIILGSDGSRCLTAGSEAEIPLAISHYGQTDLSGATVKWRAVGRSVRQLGELTVSSIKQGELTQVGAVKLRLPTAPTGYKFELRVKMLHDGETINTNNWSFWAFPDVGGDLCRQNAGETTDGVMLRIRSAAADAIPAAATLVIADSVDNALADYVEAGGRVILFTSDAVTGNPAQFTPYLLDYRTFRPIPWNRGPGNLGTVITDHPALGRFPHDDKCDLQFVRMIHGALPMQFEPLRRYGVTPIIRAIDWYQTNHNNAYLLELGVGKGKALVTSLNVLDDLADRIEPRNLLRSLLDYAKSDLFQPKANVPGEEFRRLFGQKAQR